MPGPVPKPPGLRQRRNHVATRSSLPSVQEAARNKVPPLYKRERSSEKWHDRVVAWWEAAWKSPMASEWLKAETVGVVYRLAELLQAFWSTDDVDERVKIEGRIQHAESELGLTPIARRRLQWEVEKGEEAVERTDKRRARKKLDETAKQDPRDVLRMAK